MDSVPPLSVSIICSSVCSSSHNVLQWQVCTISVCAHAHMGGHMCACMHGLPSGVISWPCMGQTSGATLCEGEGDDGGLLLC